MKRIIQSVVSVLLVLAILSSFFVMSLADSSSSPTITEQPQAITAPAGSSVTWNIKASGTGLTYQWQYYYNNKWTNFVNGTGTSITKTVTSEWNGWKIRCIVKDSNGNSVTSDEVKFTIGTPSTLTITEQPQAYTGPAGSSVTWSVKATGTGLTYKWQYYYNNKWTDFVNGTGISIKKTVTSEWNGWKIRVIVSDSAGNSVTSNAVNVTISSGPSITTQPVNVTAADGATATFTVKANGTGLKYQWQVQLAGKTTWQNTSLSGNTVSV